MGLLQTKEEDYFIEPMARMERQPHLFYKRSTLLRLMSQNSSLSRGCALKSSFPQGTAVTSQMSFVTHSFPPRWGRNECVKNEPQRTSAGRLYCSYACSSRRSASKDGAKESVSSALHFAPNNPVIETHGTSQFSSPEPPGGTRGSGSGLQKALGKRMGTGNSYAGYMFIRIHLLGLKVFKMGLLIPFSPNKRLTFCQVWNTCWRNTRTFRLNKTSTLSVLDSFKSMSQVHCICIGNSMNCSDILKLLYVILRAFRRVKF